MNLIKQSSKPTVDRLCLRLRSASWVTQLTSVISLLALWPLAGHAQSVTATVPVGNVPGAVAVNPVTNKIYVVNEGFSFNSNPGSVTVIDGASDNTTNVAVGRNPVDVAVNPVTNKIYVTNLGNDSFPGSLTVIDGATNTTTTVGIGAAVQAVDVAVNPVTGKAYVATDINTMVITEAQVQPSPLNTVISPIPGNMTTSAAQAFQFTATNSVPLPVTNLYFQFDTFEGPWSQGVPSGALGSFTGTAAGLSVGTHTLYAFATDGEEATSVMQASSPVIGGISAYFFEELGTSTSTTLAADVNSATFGDTVTFTAAVSTNPSSSTVPAGFVSFSDGSTLVGGVALDNAGHAVFATNAIPAGVRPITAFYVPSPSAGFAASTSMNVNVTILDFSIGVVAGGSTSATVTAGQTANYALQLSLVGGAAPDQLMVTVSCTGAPSNSTCTGSPSPETVTSTGPAAVTISVSTKANALLIPPAPFSRLRTPWNHLSVLWVLTMLLVPLLVRCLKRREGYALAPRLALTPPLLLLATAIVVMNGCGDGGSSTTPPPGNNGTPPGTYTLTVTGTSGNLTRIQKLTLTVQ